jgi:hypothetical protein
MGEGVGFVLYHMIANDSELLGKGTGPCDPALPSDYAGSSRDRQFCCINPTIFAPECGLEIRLAQMSQASVLRSRQTLRPVCPNKFIGASIG